MSKDGMIKIALVVGLIFTASCASTEKTQRRQARDKAVVNNQFYCEFLNGETYTDLDVMLNITMAEKCDVTQPFSVTNYQSISEIPGIMYCCSTKSKASAQVLPTSKSAKSSAVEPKSDLNLDDDQEVEVAKKGTTSKANVAAPAAPVVTPAATPTTSASPASK